MKMPEFRRGLGFSVQCVEITPLEHPGWFHGDCVQLYHCWSGELIMGKMKEPHDLVLIRS